MDENTTENTGIASAVASLTGTNGDIVEKVIKRLASFGYEATETDEWALGFAIQKSENTIKNECAIPEIPEGLVCVLVDMACGEFLTAKKQTGQLDIAGLDLSGAVTGIKEGDTQINFNGDESDSDKLDSLLNKLLNGGRGELVCYRRIRW